ncbi:hypothetical protein B566_EDAN007724 [Ephemera danica]|nr:hypothetical protein B566_EDAN007724 [Ephemera danica]
MAVHRLKLVGLCILGSFKARTTENHDNNKLFIYCHLMHRDIGAASSHWDCDSQLETHFRAFSWGCTTHALQSKCRNEYISPHNRQTQHAQTAGTADCHAKYRRFERTFTRCLHHHVR